MGYLMLAKMNRIELIVNKSKFIATSSPVRTEKEAASFVAQLKKEFWDATHNVYAYVIGENNEIMKCSDDGEPQGTAGRPSLEAIKTEKIKYCAVVVTRYFGGTLLGASGLIRAYAKATKDCLESAEKLERRFCQSRKFSISYSDFNNLDKFIKSFECFQKDTIFEQDIFMSVVIPIEKVKEFDLKVCELLMGNYHPEIGEAIFEDVPVNCRLNFRNP